MSKSACGMCGGDVELLGTLGTIVWGRCVNCGADQTMDAREVDAREVECDDEGADGG